MNEEFKCNCGGETKVVDEAHILHACKNKYSQSTSYYDGISRFIEYERAQINSKITSGAIKYNWFVKWS